MTDTASNTPSENHIYSICDRDSELINEMLADTTPANAELKELLVLGEYLHKSLTAKDWQAIIDILDNPFIKPCEREQALHEQGLRLVKVMQR